MKNNDTGCLFLSPGAYLQLMDEVNDARLLAIAAERMERYDPTTAVSAESLYQELGITQEDIDLCGEVEIE